MLGRCIERQLMLVFLPEKVVCQATTIDDMLGLFGNISLKRFQIKLITSTTELIGRMILHIQSAELGRTIIGTETESIHVQLTDFREAIPIHIMRITVTIRLIYSYTINIVLRHQRSVGTHVLFPSLSIDIRHGRSHLERIVDRVFGNDVDSTPYGIRTKQGRTSATNHFHAFNHIGRNLLQSIYPRKSADNRSAIDENL